MIQRSWQSTAKYIEQITAPAGLLRESERQPSRLLAWLLLSLLALAALTLPLAFADSATRGTRQTDYVFLIAGVMLILATALGLNHVGRYRAAAALTVAGAVAAPWLSTVLDPLIERGNLVPLAFTGLSVLLCSLLLTPRTTAVLSIVQGTALLLFPFTSNTSHAIDWPNLWTFFFFTAVLSIVAAIVRQKNQIQIDLQTSRVAAIEAQQRQQLEEARRQIQEREREQGRLLAQVRTGRERLKILSRQLLQAQENERRYIARELHDEIGQVLTSVKLSLQAAERLPQAAAIGPALADSMTIIDRAVQQVRELSLDLRPSMLDDFGLPAALEWYVERQAQRIGLGIELRVAPELAGRLPAELETVCFRIVQEAMTNVARYARAQHAVVALAQRANELELQISDDGVGFNVAEARARAVRGVSLGLLGMEERATLIGGRMEIASEPGQGTEIRAYFPLHSPYLQRRLDKRSEL